LFLTIDFNIFGFVHETKRTLLAPTLDDFRRQQNELTINTVDGTHQSEVMDGELSNGFSTTEEHFVATNGCPLPVLARHVAAGV